MDSKHNGHFCHQTHTEWNCPTTVIQMKSKMMVPDNVVSDQTPTMEALMQCNNSVPGLVVLCHGLKSPDSSDMISIDNNPWRSMSCELTKPKAKLYRAKVLWHHQV